MSMDNLQSLYSEVQYEWPQLTDKNANPLDTALPLLDNTSVGLAHKRGGFGQLKQRVSAGLKSAVVEHFEVFNDSINSYRSVVQNISHSTRSIEKIKKTVNDSLENLKSDDVTISSLNENWRSYNDMIVILTVIEEIKAAPNELENAINEKNYSKAEELLHIVNRKAHTYGLWKLSALSNLQTYFKTQENQLFDILIEQLHEIIFSKREFTSYNSVSEFLKQSRTTKYSNIEKFLLNLIDIDLSNSSSLNHNNLEDFLKVLNSNDQINLDDDLESEKLTKFDETNPFNQIHYILNIIHKLGKFPLTVEILIQRTTLEVNQLINRVTEATKLRHSKIIKALNSIQSPHSLLHHLSGDNYSSVVLKDLFWNFFKKILFYEQSIVVIIQIHAKLQSYNPDRLHFSFADTPSDNILDMDRLWKLLKTEIKNLILTYISSDDSSTSLHKKATTSSTITNTDPKSSLLFQFYNVDYDKEHNTNMKSVLQDLFPGFINFNEMANDSPYIEDSKFLKHTNIIPSTIFNMRHVLEPFLLFIEGTGLLAPKKVDDSFSFFNSFMTEEFLPLLEESFISFYHEEVEESDSFELYEPPYDFSNIYNNTEADEKSIFKLFIDFKSFLNKICFILNTSLQFRREFSSIIFRLLDKFEDKIQELYNDLFNEIINYLEPNREIIQLLKDQSKQSVPNLKIVNLNKNELKTSTVLSNFKTLKASLEFILELLEHKFVKTVDLMKTDINLTMVEKLRKNWSFFEVVNMNNDSLEEEQNSNLHHISQIILNDELNLKYRDIISGYKALHGNIANVLNKLDVVLN